jgi:hypothetical protein
MRMFVWVPAAIDDVRQELGNARVSAAVLVPVETGTVVVLTEPVKVGVAAKWTYVIGRKLRTVGVVVVWNEDAAGVYPVTGALALGWEWGGDEAALNLIAVAGRRGRIGRALLSAAQTVSTSRDNEAKQNRAAGRIASALRADVGAVTGHVRRWEYGGLPAVVELLTRAGKPDVIPVVRRMDAGTFERWRGEVLPVVPLTGGR